MLAYSAQFWLGLLVAGVALGAVYALFATGLTMVFGAARIMNFAQGELFMIGGYLAWFAHANLDMAYWTTLVAATVGVGLFGLLSSVTLFRTVSSGPRSLERGIVMTLGLSIVLQEAALKLWGIANRRPAGPIDGHSVDIGGVTIQGVRFVAIGIAAIALAALAAFLRRTRIGLAIRAVPANPDLAKTLGVPEAWVRSVALGVGSALSGLAAATIAPFYGVFPTMGNSFVFTGFAILFMGGMTSVAGTALASLLVGVAVSIAGGAFSASAATLAPLLVMAVVVLAKPHGLLGQRMRSA